MMTQKTLLNLFLFDQTMITNNLTKYQYQPPLLFIFCDHCEDMVMRRDRRFDTNDPWKQKRMSSFCCSFILFGYQTRFRRRFLLYMHSPSEPLLEFGFDRFYFPIFCLRRTVFCFSNWINCFLNRYIPIHFLFELFRNGYPILYVPHEIPFESHPVRSKFFLCFFKNSFFHFRLIHRIDPFYIQ